MPAQAPFRVAIAGGGIAGVSALMALADLGEGRFEIDMITPARSFVLRPQMIGVPWGGPPLHLELDELARTFGATRRHAALQSVDAELGEVVTGDGETRSYDAVIVATGATPGIAYEGVWTIGFGPLPDVLSHPTRGSVAVVVPPGTGWTLPAYQLALLAAMNGDADVRVVTPERRALELFGPAALRPVARFLDRNGVDVETERSLPAAGYEANELADHVVSLPILFGRGVRGLPAGPDGFIPVDEHQRIRGVDHVYAIGDITHGTVKQGGLAAQQAERAAAEIARSAGLAPRVLDEPPILRGKLIAGDEHLYLRRALDHADQGRTSETPLWRPEAAMLAWRLSRWLASRGKDTGADVLGPVAHAAHRTEPF